MLIVRSLCRSGRQTLGGTLTGLLSAGLLLGILAAPALPAGAQPIPEGPVFQVSLDDAGPQTGPALAVGERGEAAYLWFGLCPEFDLCHRAFGSTGFPLTEPAALDTGGVLLDAVPATAVDADGNLVLVWSEPGLGFERRIAGRRYTFEGTPLGEPFIVASASAQVYDRPDVAVTPDGDLVVAFERLRFDGTIGEGDEEVPVYTGIEILGVVLSPTGTPRGEAFPVDGATPDEVSSPSVAAAGGELLFAWESFAGFEQILARRFSDADAPTPLGDERALTAILPTGRRRGPRAAASDTGSGAPTFLVAWADQDSSSAPSRVRAQVVDGADVRFPSPFQVGAGDSPRVDGGDGVFAVAWAADLDGGARAVEGVRYDALGVPLETPFQVNSPPGPVGAGTPLTPAVGLFGGTGLDSGLDSGLVFGWRHRSPQLAYTVLGRRYPGQLPPPPPCVDGPRTLCLGAGDRFEVQVVWTTQPSGPSGPSGTGQRVKLTADTGYFWFFRDTNVEMVVKVLDGCPVNGRFWVFAGGLTNVGVEMTVRDTETDATEVYRNDLGEAFQPIQDTGAFFCTDTA